MSAVSTVMRQSYTGQCPGWPGSHAGAGHDDHVALITTPGRLIIVTAPVSDTHSIHRETAQLEEHLTLPQIISTIVEQTWLVLFWFIILNLMIMTS